MPLWLPASLADEERTGFCRLCKTRLKPGEAAAHIVNCYRRNEAEVRGRSLRERAPGLAGDEGVDTEYERFWQERDYRGALD